MTSGTLTGLLATAAAVHGDRIAVDDGETAMTYAELRQSATRLGGRLGALGVRPGDRVGLLLPKGIAFVVAAHGVLAAGAVYVPLDLSAPAERLAAVLDDCGVRAVVADPDEADRVAGMPVVTDPLAAVPGDPGVAGQAVREPDDAAYILYTSGSTGRPKGVVLSHRNALAFVDWAADYFAVTPDDRIASPAPPHFDLTVFDLFVPVRAGARVVPAPPEVAAFPVEAVDFMREHGITLWYAVPSQLIMLSTRGGLPAGGLPALRAVLYAGEVFPPARLATLMAQLDGVVFHNLYGPTETNVCACHTLTGPPDGPVPIGVPASGAELSAHADDGTPVPDGAPGELWVRGPSVMRGYWGADPVALHRTGDTAWRDGSGRWHFVGRRDHQVKSRGYRIELGDVEAALLTCPGVLEGVVVAVPDELITNRLTAFVTATAGVTAADVAAHCARVLPRHMAPDPITVVDALPRTSTGKVDRTAVAARHGAARNASAQNGGDR
ncbi:amino acid adenylation domain-containing protein [Saccharothrix obliqua]|uniref:amino acid adenylation domain-containing protein n=1 Tax=Saccharothrix obliqua TaxID=2861747 RepID=UPI001C5E6EA4|nr:amino acid adenylation domain-containing protein [Saccharothrix obliqua]MBW4720406.1 amino acid adenylation domain-containing protein [Saccharothrix obliqua]